MRSNRAFALKERVQEKMDLKSNFNIIEGLSRSEPKLPHQGSSGFNRSIVRKRQKVGHWGISYPAWTEDTTFPRKLSRVQSCKVDELEECENDSDRHTTIRGMHSIRAAIPLNA